MPREGLWHLSKQMRGILSCNPRGLLPSHLQVSHYAECEQWHCAGCGTGEVSVTWMSSSRGSYRPCCGLPGRLEYLHCLSRQGVWVHSGCCSKRQRPGGVKQQKVTSPGWRPESQVRWPAELGEALLRTEDSLCPLMAQRSW